MSKDSGFSCNHGGALSPGAMSIRTLIILSCDIPDDDGSKL